MKILIADDHDLVRTGLSQLLQSMDHSFEIFQATNYQEIIEHQNNDISLLLLDFSMPGVSNVKKVEQICMKMMTTAVVVISGSEDALLIKACMNAGVMGFIPKSSSNDVIKSAIQLVLSGDQYFPYTFLKNSKASNVISLKITRRQEDVWRLLVKGLSNKEIARELFVTEGTVKQHVSSLFKKLSIRSRVEAVNKANILWTNGAD